MKKENYEQYLRLRREAKYLVEYAFMLIENWNFYDSEALMDFLDDVVRYLGSKKSHEKFNGYRMRSDSSRRKDQTVIASE
jgi:hypothetical protein